MEENIKDYFINLSLLTVENVNFFLKNNVGYFRGRHFCEIV